MKVQQGSGSNPSSMNSRLVLHGLQKGMLLIVCRYMVFIFINLITMDKILKCFGANVRSERERNRFSQEALADRCGLHRTYIGGVERGERNIGLVNLVRISQALEVQPSHLLRNISGEGRAT